jgi:hypothetical protein
MEGKMKKIFTIFMAGLPFMVESVQAMSIEDGSFEYSPYYGTPDEEMACYPPTTKDRYGWSHRTFSQHASPKSSVTINKVVFPVTSIVNIAYEMPASFPTGPYDEETGDFIDDVAINTAVDDNTLESIRIPASIQLFDEYCFYQCRALEKVEFEQNSQLKKIGRGAFFSCVSLKSITIPKSTQSLDKECFDECKKLKNVTFEPDSNLEQIGESAFIGCLTLEKVEFGQNSQLQRIGKSAFFCCLSLKSITIPNSVQFLDERCFFHCENLRELIFEPGSNLEQIGESAFDDCPALESIIVPASMDITPLRNYFGTKLDDLIYVVND